MKTLTQEQVERATRELGANVPGLGEEIRNKLRPRMDAALEHAAVPRAAIESGIAFESAMAQTVEESDVAEERIMALGVGARPVTRILDNKVTLEFLGPASPSWSTAIDGAKDRINPAIPAVGRIELNNSDLPWAGTGWLIAPGIIVTNRHVAQEFARKAGRGQGFVFKPGLLSGSVSADIDFLEEENRLDSVEHPIVSVLWIAPPDESDVAFLRVTRAVGGPPLPAPIELAEADAAAETVIAAIGYPARDPSIRDQALVVSIFGNDVYEKKRLAPGKVMGLQGTTLKHDCSTLGGNSGSVLLDLATGRAVGLHRGGLVDDSANVAVTASHVKKLLEVALSNEAPTIATATSSGTPGGPGGPGAVSAAASATGGAPDGNGLLRLVINVPLEITVRLGSVALPVAQQIGASAVPPGETALEAAKRLLGADPRVLRIRRGYRFKNGWITSEPVIVIEVREKLPFDSLRAAGVSPLPREIMGVGIDVRTAPVPVQLSALGIDVVAVERPGKPAGYKEPPGFDDPDSTMFLARVRERMDAIFHVSPDAGFANLKAFFSRIHGKLTATIYEWEPNHISDALEEAIKPEGRTLKMVTQKKGVGGRDATETAVDDMKTRLKSGKFKHVWASVQGPQRLIPTSYHIKVASRDGEEFWLSSGNWKDSNQPKNATKASVLRTNNREWHAVIKNEKLAKLFQKYIEFDFRQATKFPLEDGEAPVLPDIELFVPEPSPLLSLERVPNVTYEDTLTIQNEELDVQPLLTPDRDGQGRRMFMKAATDMIERAQRRIFVQNQSFNLTEENNEEFEKFFAVLKEKQETHEVKIIFRDGSEFPGGDEQQQKLLEILQDFGLDTSTDSMRIQKKCHTKGIIVDSSEVLIGSQNLTNGGSLFNRDASLLVRSPKVAKFYEKIFLFDWENLADNIADEGVAGIRRAAPGEVTPPGFRRVKLSDLLQDD